jgi:dipeptidase D
VRLQLPLSFEPTGDAPVYDILVGGLNGGHSGVDIHKHRASANRILARLLGEIQGKLPFYIADLKGGSAHNAIARDAQATIVLPGDHFSQLEAVIQSFLQTLRAEYSATDPSISIQIEPGQASRKLSESDTQKVISLLQALPHGVAEMSASVDGFVETSNNLALIKVQGEELHIHSSQRSTVMSRLNEITQRVAAIGYLAGAQVVIDDGYPAWQPDMDSPLLSRSCSVYERVFGERPKVEMIHAGLECGIIGNIFGGMDMISLGATVQNPHSPHERLYLSSLIKVWDLLVELLRSYKPD